MISEADIKFPNIPFKKTSVLIIIGLVIYICYLYLVGFDSIRDVLLKANYWYLGLAIIVSLGANAFHTAGWWVYLRDKKYPVSFFKAYQIYLSSIYFVNLIPTVAVSGEVSKIYFIEKSTPSARFDKTLATCVISRALEFFPISLGATISILYLAFFYNMPSWATAFCLFIAGTIGAMTAVGVAVAMNDAILRHLSNSAFQLLERLMKKDMTAKIRNMDVIITQFDASFKEITAKKRLIALSLALISTAWCLDISVAYISFQAIGNPVTPVLVVTVYSVMTVLQMLPIFLPGGLGLVDIAMTLLYMMVGIPKAAATGTTIIVRFITLWFLTTIGGLITLYLANVHGKNNAK